MVSLQSFQAQGGFLGGRGVAWSSCSSQYPWAGTGDAVARLLWLMTAGSIPSLAMLISVVVFSR